MDANSRVELHWIPLGAGARSVRFNGLVYEALSAATHRRKRCDLYHSALSLDMPDGRYWVEMTPVPDRFGERRGVVATGPVGMRALGHVRLFRYEVRRWRNGVVPDLQFAVDSPVLVTDDAAATRRVFDLLPLVPRLTWGRDELHTGDMWSCNSIVSWTLRNAGIDLKSIAFPHRSRAPGWDAGRYAPAASPQRVNGVQLLATDRATVPR